ncbi:20272_t:CDS:2 [Rhizophagus irregularis]|nr:20272_t:CDS:2 [Rhizophagus irregularis]
MLTYIHWTADVREDSAGLISFQKSGAHEFIDAFAIDHWKYSTESHTGKFFASKISAIIEKIGVEKYSHIWDLRCIAHTINLMADDLVKLDNIKDLILDRGKITRFFNNSHQASAILFQGLKNMKIKIEGLQTWSLGVNDDGFRNAAIAATTLWQNLGYPEILKNNAENFSVNLGGLIKN